MPDPSAAADDTPSLSEASFFALAAQMAEGGAPAPAAAAEEAPAPVIELEAPAASAPTAAAPAPAASADSPSPAPAAPAPAPADPNTLNPDAPRNYRIQAQDAIEQRTLQLRAQNRELTLPAALEQAYRELGLPTPFTPPAAAPATATPEPAPQAATDPLARIEADIAAREEALTDLNPALDADEWKRVNAELRKLEREAARLEAQQAAQSQFQQVSAEQAMQQVETALHSEFNVLADASHPFTIAFEQRRAQVYQTGTDEQLSDPNLELNLALQMEQDFQTRYGMAVRPTPSSSPAAQPQAQAPVTQPPAPPAVAPVPAALPRSAAAPLSGAPASVSPVTGITPPNPQEKFQSLLRSDSSLNADEAANAMLSGFFGGQGAPGFHHGRLAAA